MNVDMEVRIVQGHGLPFGKIFEFWFGEPPLLEQGEAYAYHGDVTGVLLTQNVVAPWEEDTDWVMPNKILEDFRSLCWCRRFSTAE